MRLMQAEHPTKFHFARCGDCGHPMSSRSMQAMLEQFAEHDVAKHLDPMPNAGFTFRADVRVDPMK